MWYLFLCYFTITSAELYKTNYYKGLYYNDDIPEYFYHYIFSFKGDTIHIKVRGTHEVYVALSPAAIIRDHLPMYEILIGTSNNTQLAIRYSKNPNSPTILQPEQKRKFWDIYGSHYDTCDYLNSKKYCEYWIRMTYWNEGNTSDYHGWRKRRSYLKIDVGYSGNPVPLLTRIERNPVDINFYGISSLETEAWWIVHDQMKYYKKIWVESRKNATNFETEEKLFLPYFKVRFDIIRLKLRGSGAFVALSRTPFESRPLCYISLSSFTVVNCLRENGSIETFDGKYGYKGIDLFNEYEFHDFWIKLKLYNDSYSNKQFMNYQAGIEFEEEPIINVTDPEGYKVKWYSIGTIDEKISGTWILEDTRDYPMEEWEKVLDKRIRIAAKDVNKYRKGPYFKDTFQFFQVHSNIIQFRLRTDSKAFIILTQDQEYKRDSFVVKFGDPLAQSVNTINRNGDILARFEDRLSVPYEFRGFWIKFTNVTLANGKIGLLIRVGREDEVFPVMTWTDVKPYPIKYFGISSLDSTDNTWILKLKQRVDKITYNDDVYSLELCLTSDALQLIDTLGDGQFKFFPTTNSTTLSNRVTFKVQAASNAVVIISSTASDTSPSFKFLLGENGNNESHIYRNQNLYTSRRYGMLRPKSFVSFELEWSYTETDDMAVEFKREGEFTPLLKLLTDPFPVKYFGLATTSNFPGTWSIPEFSTFNPSNTEWD